MSSKQPEQSIGKCALQKSSSWKIDSVVGLVADHRLQAETQVCYGHRRHYVFNLSVNLCVCVRTNTHACGVPGGGILRPAWRPLAGLVLSRRLGLVLNDSLGMAIYLNTALLITFPCCTFIYCLFLFDRIWHIRQQRHLGPTTTIRP